MACELRPCDGATEPHLLAGKQRQVLRGLGADGVRRHVPVRLVGGGVEQAKAEAHQQQVVQGRIHVQLRQIAVVKGLRHVGYIVPARAVVVRGVQIRLHVAACAAISAGARASGAPARMATPIVSLMVGQ